VIFAAMMEAADRDELFLIDGGLCRWHRRRDGVVVIREILVLPACRRLGRGRRMVEDIQARNPGATLLARCPQTDSQGAVGTGNTFWKHMGFTMTGTKDGINTWQRCP
jgi:GNAT superfamily N-acetyltransferase